MIYLLESMFKKQLSSNNAMTVSQAAKAIAQQMLSEYEPALKSAYARLKSNPKNDNGCIAKTAIVSALVELNSKDFGWFNTEINYTQLEPVYGGSRDAAIDIRVKCIEALTAYPWFQAAHSLVMRIGDSEHVVRMAAIKAISAYNGKEPEYVILTKTVSGDPNSEVIGECFRALNSIEAECRIELFAKHLEDENEDIRLEAAFALGESRLPEAFKILIDAWDNNILPAHRDIILTGIAAHKSREAKEFLEELKDNPTYKAKAEQALGRILLTLLLLISTVAYSVPTKVACIGNSITEGNYLWGSEPTYPERLQSTLGNTYEVRNYGVSGTTLLRNGNYPYVKFGPLGDAIAYNPDIVTIKLGTNDSRADNWTSLKGEFLKDYLWMIDTFASLASKPKIYAVLPVPAFPPSCCGLDGATIASEIIPLIREAARQRNLTVIDCHTPLLPFSSYFPDGVHPTAPGLDSIAAIISRTIKQTGASETTTQSHAQRISAKIINGKIVIDAPGRNVVKYHLYNCRGLFLKSTNIPNGVYFLSIDLSGNEHHFLKILKLN